MTPETLWSLPRVVELLAWPIDFAPELNESEPWFRVVTNTTIEVIGGDAAGNVFALLGDSAAAHLRPLLYVCHEGQAGQIAANLQEAVRLFIAAPYWRDLLKFSGGGDLQHMAVAHDLLEAELQEEEPGIDSVREELERLLCVKRLENPVSTIHHHVSRSDGVMRVTSHEGEPFDSLFNTFVPADNPS